MITRYRTWWSSLAAPGFAETCRWGSLFRSHTNEVLHLASVEVLQLYGQPEVSQLKHAVVLQDVVGLQVPVHNPLLPQLLESVHDLSHYVYRLLLVDVWIRQITLFVLLHVLGKVTPAAQFLNDINEILIFHGPVELNDVFAFQALQYVNLIVHEFSHLFIFVNYCFVYLLYSHFLFSLPLDSFI